MRTRNCTIYQHGYTQHLSLCPFVGLVVPYLHFPPVPDGHLPGPLVAILVERDLVFCLTPAMMEMEMHIERGLDAVTVPYTFASCQRMSGV